MTESDEPNVSVPVQDLLGLQHTTEGLVYQLREIIENTVAEEAALHQQKSSALTPGETLVYYRSKLDMTQSALSELSGVAANTIVNFENGKSHPRVRTLMKLAEVVGIPWNLLYEERPPSEKKEETKEEKGADDE